MTPLLSLGPTAQLRQISSLCTCSSTFSAFACSPIEGKCAIDSGSSVGCSRYSVVVARLAQNNPSAVLLDTTVKQIARLTSCRLLFLGCECFRRAFRLSRASRLTGNPVQRLG